MGRSYHLDPPSSLDSLGTEDAAFAKRQCGEFEQPSRCRDEPKPMRYCIDRNEYPNQKGELPRVMQSWHDELPLPYRSGPPRTALLGHLELQRRNGRTTPTGQIEPFATRGQDHAVRAPPRPRSATDGIRCNQDLTPIGQYTTRVLLRVVCKRVTERDGGSV
jgi:hypothetical protein